MSADFGMPPFVTDVTTKQETPWFFETFEETWLKHRSGYVARQYGAQLVRESSDQVVELAAWRERHPRVRDRVRRLFS